MMGPRSEIRSAPSTPDGSIENVELKTELKTRIKVNYSERPRAPRTSLLGYLSECHKGPKGTTDTSYGRGFKRRMMGLREARAYAMGPSSLIGLNSNNYRLNLINDGRALGLSIKM